MAVAMASAKPIEYPAIGICGLSCRLCPTYHAVGKSRCGGCKSAYRMGAGCPFITCALKRKGIEFCWQCGEGETCERWLGHRAYSREHDTFVCYQNLEENIAAVRRDGVRRFQEVQQVREQLLIEMLRGFNEGRSKRLYCIAATVLELDELRAALAQAEVDAGELDLKGRARALHAILARIARQRGYHLKLRK
jgi:hypothetical protein